METKNLSSIKNTHTYSEIFAQPMLWRQVYDLICAQRKELGDFLDPLLAMDGLRIILTGAGSSAFIGEASQGIIQRQTGILAQAIATTDLVTHPKAHILKNIPTLAVSFARSGNSPESLEAIRLLDHYCDHVSHLLITCNADGKVASYGKENKQKAYSLILPEETNDKALAMTGSFTSMLLSSLLIFDLPHIELKETSVLTIIKQANALLDRTDEIKHIAGLNFKRAVFLGSGPALGIARECHLKLQELTDGQVICKYDSFLGFRHGPRVVADEEALLVYLASQDAHVMKYEEDLIASIASDPRNLSAISVGRGNDHGLQNILATFGESQVDTHGLYIIPYTLIGQLLGFFKSASLGLNPDNPSVTGAITRVVEGVVIYDHQE